MEPTESLEGNILIVDDTPANLRLLSGMLTEQGYKVRAVINGPMALTAARTAPPDLILLDINMPEMNGYEVCAQLKEDERTRDIAIVFISALGETADKIKAFTVGGVDYITKPFQLEEVLARVQTHLALRNLQRRLQEANSILEQRVQERTAELVRLNAAMERFVPREFLEFLHKGTLAEVQLGDQVQREMTILFSDIWGFTTRSEQLSPAKTFAFLNDYLERVSPLIRQQNGFIDKYLGDGLMALFPGTADDAVRAAIAMHQEVARHNAAIVGQDLPPMRIGVGMHTGSLMMGILGEKERLQGTVISDAVNLAGRLEELTRTYGVSTVISEQTLQRLQDPSAYRTRFLGCVHVKGKREEIAVYEVLDGEPEEMVQLKLATQADFEAGLRLYHEGQHAEASNHFGQVLQQHPEDTAAQFYLGCTSGANS